MKERVFRRFEERCDVIIFGHSHIPCNRRVDHTLLFNPGSLSGNVKPPFDATYGVLTIDGDGIWAEIFKLN